MASTDIIAWITGGYGKYFLSPWCIVIVWMYKLSTIQMNEENQKNQGQSADKGNSGIKNYGWLAAAVIIAAILGGYFIFRNDIRNMDQLPDNVTLKNETTGETETIIFENPKKSAHYEGNTPSHGDKLAGVPINVVIDFNFDLASPSAISVKMNGKEYGIGETIIDTNKLSMRKKMDPDSPDGLYDVAHNACWPDGSCHDGKFQFAIDRSGAGDFADLRGQKEVMIKMKNIAFEPGEIIISPGTVVTWVQEDDAEHFVNTETHPAHTYFPAQNSRGLKLGDTFSTTFEKPGIYPYHCSAHASVMTGTILVISPEVEV
ncbi:MAG: hypothetical protein A2359_03605 [Candidatus Moranbacteria bacterium RIFOXYB1_FULL_43_19]|nr:MAG: hypothetical protein A2184_02230 [Candidatus Moranbacteria bacterium RIFOXYA1_FULL_44_7]OGI26733.1 MAG: hypothetical protein A2359_03605 [Candidatus Moranbacteria bacterium RIFOXYB1_FULL_43_19]OGI32506.1 MAG: hypothetical protein A2420_02930 [Candidatus Moranbacteria bacterium RIFOXYC1_FULL_44_13]OGI37616.1 MAG: hypothetical protein A2612_04285 [Candidatus Moranbacteria bacterium RIFOXYD1_FULL_44_12]